MIRKISEIVKRLETLDIPIAYSHFTERKEPPFICYLIPESNTNGADDLHIIKRSKARIELYTDQRGFTFENDILKLFTDVEVSADSTYIESEGLFVTCFEFDYIEKI